MTKEPEKSFLIVDESTYIEKAPPLLCLLYSLAPCRRHEHNSFDRSRHSFSMRSVVLFLLSLAWLANAAFVPSINTLPNKDAHPAKPAPLDKAIHPNEAARIKEVAHTNKATHTNKDAHTHKVSHHNKAVSNGSQQDAGASTTAYRSVVYFVNWVSLDVANVDAASLTLPWLGHLRSKLLSTELARRTADACAVCIRQYQGHGRGVSVRHLRRP